MSVFYTPRDIFEASLMMKCTYEIGLHGFVLSSGALIEELSYRLEGRAVTLRFCSSTHHAPHHGLTEGFLGSYWNYCVAKWESEKKERFPHKKLVAKKERFFNMNKKQILNHYLREKDSGSTNEKTGNYIYGNEFSVENYLTYLGIKNEPEQPMQMDRFLPQSDSSVAHPEGLPHDFKSFGVMTTKCGKTGTLVRSSESGIICMLYGGVLKKLDTSDIEFSSGRFWTKKPL